MALTGAGMAAAGIERQATRRVKSGGGRTYVPTREIAAHPAFLPMLTLWGAALLGLSVAVLSPGAIARIVAITNGSALGSGAHAMFAASAGLLGAALAFCAARAMGDYTRPRISSKAILPCLAAHLCEDEAFATVSSDQPQQRNEENAQEQSQPDEADAAVETSETATDYSADLAEPQLADPQVAADPSVGSRPRALDLTEFGQLAGRDGVWVHETVEMPESNGDASRDAVLADSTVSAGPTRALEQLRGTATRDLSLLQMVERFAAALHAQQDADRDALRKDASDAGLAEALRALELFTLEGFRAERAESARIGENSHPADGTGDTSSPLQGLRGAA